MSVSGPYNDTPFQIDYEGAQIELVFTKTTPDTAKLTWNIPTPFVGCNDDTGAYNGIIITLDSKSVENAQRPANGTFYTPDSTADVNLHAGDRIGDALVVGAFYDDDTTTALEVGDIKPHTAYYFSAYAVDQQGRYHRAGVHAYALDWAKETKDRDYPGYQEFRVLGPVNKKVAINTMTEPSTSMLHSQWTGFKADGTYTLTVSTDTLEPTEVEIAGADAQTYEDFVKAFNTSLSLAIAPVLNEGPPNVGSYYVDVKNQKAYTWAGNSYVALNPVFSATTPDAVSDGTLWVDQFTGVISKRVDGQWEQQEFVRYHKPFNNLNGSDYWISASYAAQWEGAVWCKRQLATTPIDPSLDVTPVVGSFWYDPKTGLMYAWDDQNNCWATTNIIFSAVDPSNIDQNTLWYDYDKQKLFIFNNQKWVEANATYNVLPPKTAADDDLWVDTKNEKVKRYNFQKRSWEDTQVIYWHTDPRNRQSCDKWWQSVNGVDKVYVWDFIALKWTEATSFVQSETDPRETKLPVGFVWNRTDGHYFAWDGMAWVEITAIELPYDPRNPVEGQILQVGSDWMKWTSGSWVELEVLTNDNDPAALPIGELWFDASVKQLKQLTASGWTSVPYAIKPQVPKVGDRYFDTKDNQLKEWQNSRWQAAKLPLRMTINELNNVMFIGSTLGSNGTVKIDFDQAFKDAIKPYFLSKGAVPGHDAVSNVPSYKQQDVGTDGSVDERREVITAILMEMGLGGVNIELTKAQMERAVDMALEKLRQASSAAYKRGFMFMDVESTSQRYVLSNKNEGYHRIVTVHAAYRQRGGNFGAYSYNDPFDQSMIQQLYFAGTFDLLSYHLLMSYNELLNEIFATHLMFTWDERTRNLLFHQSMKSKERILLDVMVERSEQDLLTDRYTRPWLIKYGKAQAMLMLAQIRGKFGSLPGAGGGVSLNAADLTSQATTYIEECMDDVENFVVNSIEEVGGGASFILG